VGDYRMVVFLACLAKGVWCDVAIRGYIPLSVDYNGGVDVRLGRSPYWIILCCGSTVADTYLHYGT